MPCSSQYNFFCGSENIGCFAAPNLQLYPAYTGKRLGFVFLKVRGSFLQTVNAKSSKDQGICPQDLTCCHGCSGKECDPKLFPAHLSSQPSIEPLEIASFPSSSPEGFQFYDTAFNLADSTMPIDPNAGTLSPINIDTTNGQPSTEAADLLRIPNSQEQNTDLNPGMTTGDFFKQTPVDLNQKITLPVENPPAEIQELRLTPEQQDNPSYQVPLDR